MKSLARISLFLVIFAITPIAIHSSVIAQDAKTDKPEDVIQPTHANVKYGDEARQVMDVYLAKSDKPTPVVFFIHGGGWLTGDKSSAVKSLNIPKLNDAGISVVAINYRYVSQAYEAGIQPPVKWPLYDAARALQLTRHNAKEWNLDQEKIGATGGSAGACTTLWLAMHDDLADPKSDDPIARESTRLACAYLSGAQTTLDPQILREWIPNSNYGGHAFGAYVRAPDTPNREKQFQEYYEKRNAYLKEIEEYSPINHASKDDPPMYLFYSQNEPFEKGTKQKDPTHSVGLGFILKEKFPSRDDVVVVYRGDSSVKPVSATDYFIRYLGAK